MLEDLTAAVYVNPVGCASVPIRPPLNGTPPFSWFQLFLPCLPSRPPAAINVRAECAGRPFRSLFDRIDPLPLRTFMRPPPPSRPSPLPPARPTSPRH